MGQKLLYFEGDAYFKEFFNRNNQYQCWIGLLNGKNILVDWGLHIGKDLSVLGFQEVINDGSVYCHEGEISFVGELE